MSASLWQIFGVNPRTVVDVLSAALTPVIAVVTVLIAYQQRRKGK